MNAKAQQFVTEQIELAYAQMRQEIERQVAARTGAEIVAEDPPLSQNRNPDFGQESE